MMKVILFMVALFVVASTASELKSLLQSMSMDEINTLCDQINDPSHHLFSPLRCVREGEDLAASGKKFKATHKVDADNLNPVVLLPGLGGSSLQAQIHKNDSKAWYCFKNLDWFRIWFAIEELVVQPCWMDNLGVSFNPSTGAYNNTAGVLLEPIDFGGVTGVAYLDYKFGIPISLTSYYASVVKSLEEIGYVAGTNLHGAPYDWRLPATYIEKMGWYAQLQSLIETTYSNNGNRRVHIVTHSMGGPTALYFLNNVVNQKWLDTYVESFIPVSGPWTGAPNALRAVLSGDNFGLSFAGVDILNKQRIRGVARQAGGVMELVPNTDLNTADTPFVNDGTRNYTIADFPTLFTAAGTPESIPVYNNVINLVESLTAPQVTTHCVYGMGVETESFYTYPDANFDKDPIISMGDGDGTVPLYSLQECQRWVKLQPQPVDWTEFNLVGHGDILKDDEFIQYLLKIVTNSTA